MEHFFICCFAILCVFFSEVSVKVSGSFLNQVVYYWVLRVVGIFWIKDFITWAFWKYLLSLWFLFSFPDIVFLYLTFWFMQYLQWLFWCPWLPLLTDISVHSWSALSNRFLSSFCVILFCYFMCLVFYTGWQTLWILPCGCWVFLAFCKYSWALFWDIVKLYGNHLVL